MRFVSSIALCDKINERSEPWECRALLVAVIVVSTVRRCRTHSVRDNAVIACRWELMERTFHVYILASESGVLYAGMTSNLVRRVQEHQAKKIPGFARTYNVTKLVWFETHGRASSAIGREKQIKTWARWKKVALIETSNPRWKDLSAELR